MFLGEWFETLAGKGFGDVGTTIICAEGRRKVWDFVIYLGFGGGEVNLLMWSNLPKYICKLGSVGIQDGLLGFRMEGLLVIYQINRKDVWIAITGWNS
ncbi:hypothetical protein [Sphaerospermopsis torques-reginae]|uniref:Uncharacterized protein n=1 Tax=Sphaerospermopsis torques-reginae ITEP-024 TaxID=984208 RepID=A0ABX8X4A4_9CYAN|nr:hypothetical protein [Sphaerospermopsis torques-reginae]QYX33449.1 hypothetical protein K2F26_09090 [Sphaerospermopsis torques-reginae ITEP-024]